MSNDDRSGWSVRRFLVSLAVGVMASGCYVGADAPTPAEPRSLAGVDVDGALTLTASGEFIFDEDARALFDHFLAAEGEVDEDSLHARVRVEIEDRLEGEAVEQAWDAFTAYVEYRRRLAELSAYYSGSEPGDAVEPMVARMAEIRAQTVGDVPGIADEGPQIRVALAMRAVIEDPSLPSEARGHRLAQLQAEQGTALDPDAPSRVLMRLHAALEPIPLDDEEARREVLVEEVGEAAAQRWLALERRRAEALTARD